MQKPHPEFPALKDRVFSRLRSPERNNKYKYTSIDRIPHSILPLRMQFLVEFYACMREIDDIIDRDTALPNMWDSQQEYLDRKIDFVRSRRNPQDDVEKIMLTSSQRIGKSFGQDSEHAIWESSRNILTSLAFDQRRRERKEQTGRVTPYSKEALDRYFTTMEHDGVMKGFLTCFGENPDSVEILKPLVNATRRDYFFVRDLDRDVHEGCLNIPREECVLSELKNLERTCHESTQDPSQQSWEKTKKLQKHIPQFASEWIEDSTRSGITELDIHQSDKCELHFQPLTRMLLHFLYEKPAALFFKNSQ